MQQNETGRISFVAVPYDVFTDPSLRPTEKLTVGRLLLFAGKDGRCYPSHETLSRELCLKPRQVRNLLASLKRKGRLQWRARAGTSNEYVVVGDRRPIAGGIGTPLPTQAGTPLPGKRCSLK